jgi:hypothetical protein
MLAAFAMPAWANSTGGYDHVGTFEVPANLRPGEPVETITSAEIVAAAAGGRTLIYTDSPAGRIGFVDISRRDDPRPGGVIVMDGEPTSVATIGRWALVAVNTSESFTDPSGELAIVDTRAKRVVRRLELAGQPDSVAISPDGRFAAIVIENERDEDVQDGLIPQPPAGTLQILDLPWLRLRTVPLTWLADYAPEDPEPEFVDITSRRRTCTRSTSTTTPRSSGDGSRSAASTTTSRASRRAARAASGSPARAARTPAARGRTCSCA